MHCTANRASHRKVELITLLNSLLPEGSVQCNRPAAKEIGQKLSIAHCVAEMILQGSISISSKRYDSDSVGRIGIVSIRYGMFAWAVVHFTDRKPSPRAVGLEG